jgi:maltose O-acetyltransferase
MMIRTLPLATRFGDLRGRLLGAVGAILAFAYNHGVTWLPSRRVRRLFLRHYLKRLGAGGAIQMGVTFWHAPRIEIGSRVVVNAGCVLDGRHHGISIGDDVSIGPEAAILTLGHDPQSPTFANRGGAVRIGRRCWIAYRAVILPGITVGEGAVVGAGAVVTRDVPAFAIVAGVPAKVVGQRNTALDYQLDYDPWLS